MKKKYFSIITISYLILVVLSFTFYVYHVSDGNWRFELDGHRVKLSIFLGLMLIGLFLSLINFAGINEKGNKVTKKMVYESITTVKYFLTGVLIMVLVRLFSNLID